jgi:hypothetical protein
VKYRVTCQNKSEFERLKQRVMGISNLEIRDEEIIADSYAVVAISSMTDTPTVNFSLMLGR